MIHIVSFQLMVFVSWFSGRAKRPFAGFCLLGLPVAIYRDERAYKTLRIRVHEMIHWQQSLYLGIVPFWILYFIFQAVYTYKNNPFENEAYANDTNPTYIVDRKPFGWINYFNKSKHKKS